MIDEEDNDDNDDGIYYVKMWGDWFEVSGEGIENSLCINIPPKHYDKVDKDFILNVNNLESLRLIRDKIGMERYISLLGAKVFNEQTDHQGNQMKLYSYQEVKEKVILLEVVCPSTKRMYHLYPPNQDAKTCFEAKASTFSDKPISYRHGDASLLNINEFCEFPFSES